MDKKYGIRVLEHTKDKVEYMRIEILLKKIREEKGYSLEQLSRLTGISTSHLNYIERNEKEPSLTYAVIIAKALNIKIEDLYKIVQ